MMVVCGPLASRPLPPPAPPQGVMRAPPLNFNAPGLGPGGMGMPPTGLFPPGILPHFLGREKWLAFLAFFCLIIILPATVAAFRSYSVEVATNVCKVDPDPDPRIHLSVIVDPDPRIHVWKKLIRIRVQSGSGSEYLFLIFFIFFIKKFMSYKITILIFVTAKI